jgi:hypothetical protein
VVLVFIGQPQLSVTVVVSNVRIVVIFEVFFNANPRYEQYGQVTGLLPDETYNLIIPPCGVLDILTYDLIKKEVPSSSMA